MREFIHLLHYKIRSNLKITVNFNPINIIKNIGVLCLYAVFTIGAYKITYNSIHYSLQEVKIGLLLLHYFITNLLFILFLSVSMGNLLVSYTTLYKSNEVYFLLTKPVSYTNIFILKYLDNFFYSSTTFLLIGIAVIYGYGSYFGLSFIFYPFVLFFVFIPFLFIAASLGVLLLFLLIKLTSRFGVVPVITISIVFYIIGIFLYFKLTAPLFSIDEIMKLYHSNEIYLSYSIFPFTKYFPNFWVSEFLYLNVKGYYEYSLYYSVLLIIVSMVCLIMLILFAKLYYRKSWLTVQNVKILNNNLGNKIFPSKITLNKKSNNVILKKELLTFLREPVQWLHFGIMILFMLIFILSVMNINIRTNDPFLKTVIYIVIFLFSAFMVASVSLRFAFPALESEYKNYWKLKSAPVSFSKIYHSKLFFYLIPITIISIILLMLSHWGFRKESGLNELSTITMFFISITLVFMSYCGGTFFCLFNEKNPVRIASRQSASLVFLLSLIYIGIVTLILAFTVFGYFQNIELYREASFLSFKKVFILIAVFSLTIGVVFYFIGRKAMKRDFI